MQKAVSKQREGVIGGVQHHPPPTPPASLLLHLADHVSRDGRVEVDGVVAETLRCFVTLPTPALEGFAHLYLGSVAVLGVILDPVDILQ